MGGELGAGEDEVGAGVTRGGGELGLDVGEEGDDARRRGARGGGGGGGGGGLLDEADGGERVGGGGVQVDENETEVGVGEALGERFERADGLDGEVEGLGRGEDLGGEDEVGDECEDEHGGRW